MADAATTVRRRGVASKLRRGALPRSGYERAILGRGCGRACDACDEPVAWPQIEIAARVGARRTLYFHVDCFGIWRVAARALDARTRAERETDDGPPDVSSATAGSATPPTRPATARRDRSPTP